MKFTFLFGYFQFRFPNRSLKRGKNDMNDILFLKVVDMPTQEGNSNVKFMLETAIKYMMYCVTSHQIMCT